MPKLEPDTIHKVAELTVNHEEILRIRDAFEEHMTEGARLYARLQELIKQGSIPIRESAAASSGVELRPNPQ
jgi:hypothetical protein